MSSTLRFTSPSSIFAFESSNHLSTCKKKRGEVGHFRLLCSSPPTEPSYETYGNFNGARTQSQPNVVLVERQENGTSKRYKIDTVLLEKVLIEHHQEFENREFKGPEISNVQLSWLPDMVKEFVFPAGFPGSVSDDYLEYMMLQFPTNVTGWICHALVTSSLLKAVGVGSFSGTTAAASAAAIRWVFKDGIGAVGRLLIGGRFGNLFDDDPKQWRLYADFIGSAGSIFDLSTQLYPAYFLPLASLGNLTKAVARGLKDPSFRVIQSHFAIAGNLGEVAAKEEVWEVAAQLVGLALGILILDAPGLSSSYFLLPLIWFLMRLLHLFLRYQSLSVLRFNNINLKRARMLVKSHIKHSSVPGFVECNKMENIFLWERFTKPRIIFGVSLQEVLDGERHRFMLEQARQLMRLYAKENFILFVDKESQTNIGFFVCFKAEAFSETVLRSVWQAYWLHENWCNDVDLFDLIERSLIELENRYDDFLEKLEAAGWDREQIILKVPKKFIIEEFHVG